MSMNLPFWVNVEPKDIESLDLKFRYKKMPERLTAKGYLIQGPLVLTKAPKLYMDTKQPIFYLQVESLSKVISFELGGRPRELKVDGRLTFENGNLLFKAFGEDFAIRSLSRDDIVSFDAPRSAKKSMKAFLAWCKERDEDQ